MLEDRAGLGPEALAKAANELVAAANKDKIFAGVFTLFNSGAPSVFTDIDRLKAEKVGLTPSDVDFIGDDLTISTSGAANGHAIAS